MTLFCEIFGIYFPQSLIFLIFIVKYNASFIMKQCLQITILKYCYFFQIDEATLKRESATLACTRFKGVHSFDKIAEKLQDIHGEFGLNSKKIIATVTDNGSNFVKAFKEYGINTKFLSEANSEDEIVSGEFY